MLSTQTLDELQEIAPFRHRRLFQDFLPTGYRLTTLDTVEDKAEVVRLKVILGTLITLYDDYADRPDRLNSRLLSLLYRVPFEGVEVNRVFLTPLESQSLQLAKDLFTELFKGLTHFPNFDSLRSLFEFDLQQFFLANRYSEILTSCPQFSNSVENRLYLHHNMGIVMAGMIDLMSLTHLDLTEVGQARALFMLGQRAGRISNVVTTVERERGEGDVTGELVADGSLGSCDPLEQEFVTILQRMSSYRLISFSTKSYCEGIFALHHLHTNLKQFI